MVKSNLLLKNIGHLREECRSQIQKVNAFFAEQGQETIAWQDPGNLRLALFGQYNAGKSTLVNALLGDVRASMGDGPETKVAQSYDWQGYTIWDLPGRNAREDEDDAALTSLTEVHGALYVVSSQTGLDYDTIWSDLQFLENQAVPYILVINDKQRHQDETGESHHRNEIVGKFINQSECRLHNVPCFYWINARRALDARREGKVLLERKSGIVALENAIAEFIYRHDGLLRDMAELKKILPLLTQFQTDVANSEVSEEIQELSDQLTWCGQIQEKLKALALSMAEEQFNFLRSAIAASYEQAILTGQGQGVQAQVRAIVTQAWQSAVEAYRSQCQAELSVNNWTQETWNEVCFMDQFMTDGPDDYYVPPTGDGNAQFDQAVRSAIHAAGDGLKQVAQERSKEVAEQAGKQVAQKATQKLAQESTKNITEAGGKQVAQEGGKNLGKYLGPAIQIATAAWDIYQGYQKAQAEKQLVRTALKKADADAAMAVTMIKQLFLGRAANFAVEQLAPVRAEATLRLKSAKGFYSAEKQLLAEITAQHSAVQRLIDQVSSRCRGLWED